jgi:hypothetical protein
MKPRWMISTWRLVAVAWLVLFASPILWFFGYHPNKYRTAWIRDGEWIWKSTRYAFRCSLLRLAWKSDRIHCPIEGGIDNKRVTIIGPMLNRMAKSISDLWRYSNGQIPRFKILMSGHLESFVVDDVPQPPLSVAREGDSIPKAVPKVLCNLKVIHYGIGPGKEHGHSGEVVTYLRKLHVNRHGTRLGKLFKIIDVGWGDDGGKSLHDENSLANVKVSARPREEASSKDGGSEP